MTPPSPHAPDAALGLELALAVVASSTVPLLMLDGDLKVVAASDSFCRDFDVDPKAVAGRPVFDLGKGEWDAPRLRSLLMATLAGHAKIDAYEMEIRRGDGPARSLVVNAQQLVYTDLEHPRLLLSVTDVTDARAAAKLKSATLVETANLLREKAILLQEVQHRVANSLQIIASVILQSARTAQSEEARGHLTDAHHRVMSVAALQHQLAASAEGMIKLRPYFTQLCESIGASMIRDHDALRIEVRGDDSAVEAEVSVSLGLVVTELVINALKHAFPKGRRGVIVVEYKSSGADWTLSVSDNGVGMPGDAAQAKPGLGTNIVQALSKQLVATIAIEDAKPGVKVVITHTRAAEKRAEASGEARAV